uniref:DUF4482 domain-containing protein n=1 Tax=Electrophorus electricus TaxID=8005 RepID=A0AAY5EX90_ELEEL
RTPRRPENSFILCCLSELRAEMEEIRDSYLDEEVYQLQELRRELDRANKNCRILQYRLRKAEQRSLRTAQTGHVDGELLRTLEQDLKVAKDVSVRLHHELENVEDKRSRAEDENEMLRQKIIQVEISKQALHNELERAREVGPSRAVILFGDADLRCQLQFAKEESALMRKKMAKLGREKDEAEQELQKYRSTYGDVESPPALPEVPGGGPHSTREAELRLRLKLVEEEANILGRKIVELEVENRGLRAENEDLRCQYERDCFGREPFSSVPTSPYSADAPESAGELRRHLQFVEEEAELLRRSVSEMEDHNRQLTTELNRFKFGPGTGDGGESEGPEGAGVAGGRGSPASPAGPLQEELKAARVQIDELSGKVLKLQCENRVLISNMQRRDLAAHLGPRSASPRDSDADEEEAGRTLALHPKREGPVGGESDSEDVLEKTATSGFGSGGKSSDAGEPGGAEPAQRRREDREMLVAIRREAERLGKTVERLVVDTHSLICEGHLVATGAESVGLGSDFRGDGDPAEPKPDSQVLDVINGRMQVLRAELHTFMEKVDHLGDGLREHGDDLSPMPNLTESSSFLSTMTSMSRDSPIGTLGRDLVTDFQSGRRQELEWSLSWPSGSDPPLCPTGTLSLPPHAFSFPSHSLSLSLSLSFSSQEEDRRRAEARQGLDLQGLQPSEPSWPQERAQLQQEVRLLRQNTVIVYMKLRWILMHWRLGRRADAADEGLATVSLSQNGRQWLPLSQLLSVFLLPSPPLPSLSQVEDSRRVLRALRSLLEELRAELREEAQSRCQLQQTLANERAAWEIQRAEMRSRLAQLEELRGGASASGGGLDSAQREGQQQLLADSHAQALELRWKLQHSERRWSRERRELLEAFERERQEWERSLRSLRRRMEKVRRGGVTHIFASPQDSPRQAPRSPRSPRTAPAPPTHSHSDPEAALEERGAAGRVRSGDGPRPPESLFLDALSLDPLSEAEVPAPSRLDSEKRAKSVCSMSDFHRLMDSSPFLPDKSKPDERGRDEVTPPLSPDDFKYIEEFNNKGWDLSASPLAPIPPPAPPQPEARAERADARRADHSSDAFQPASWFLATSAALTAATLSSPERRQRLAVPEPYGVRVVHSPTRGECPAAGPPEQEYILSKVGKAVGEGEGEAVFSGKWPCDLREHLEGGPRPAERLGPPCATAGYAASLELSRNLSDDMKEVAFSVRNAIRSGAAGSPPERRRRRDAACQTDGFATRATQTAQTAVSVGLQTDALRALTGSPHRCLTPKGGGSTPISSPSRSLRKVQYSPTVQAKFERPCCSPKYGSPKLQRKPSSTPPPKGNSESAWARSTTTRDSPVHSTINDGLSSLFNIIDHTPITYDPMQKFNRSPSRSRPACDSGSGSDSRGEAGRGCRGRSPSPGLPLAEGEKTPETTSIRQDLSAPPGHTLAENAARILNRKLLEQSLREEKRPPAAADADKSGCIEVIVSPASPLLDLPRTAVAPPLESCFQRPSRPANRRPPSRWAAHSPSSSPSYKDRTERFRFPSPSPPAQMFPEKEEPS